MPRTEEEGKAWLAINSIDDKLLVKVIGWFVPILTPLAFVIALVLVVVYATGLAPLDFWSGIAVGACVCSGFLLLWTWRKMSIGKLTFPVASDQDRQPLEHLSKKEKRSYRIQQWTTSIAAACVTLVLFGYFAGVISLNWVGWSILLAGIGVVIYLGITLFRKTRHLVNKMTSHLAASSESTSE